MATPTESFMIEGDSIANTYRKAYELALPAIIVPTAADILYQGEYLNLSTTANKAARNIVGGGNGAQAFPVYSLKGDYNVQFSQMVTLVLGQRYIATTWVFERTGVATLGHSLCALLIALDGQNRSILTEAAAGDYIVGYTLELPASATAPLRLLAGY